MKRLCEGYSLLEVMVAIAILAMATSSLLIVRNDTISEAARALEARKVRIFLEQKMGEIASGIETKSAGIFKLAPSYRWKSFATKANITSSNTSKGSHQVQIKKVTLMVWKGGSAAKKETLEAYFLVKNPEDAKNEENKNKAFTLLEVLISMTILSLVLSMVYTILISTLSARDLVEAETNVERTANTLLNVIRRDIQAVFIYSLDGSYFRGNKTRIDFISTSDSFAAPANIKSDLCEVSYFLRENPKEPGAYKLMRREDFFIDSNPYDGGYALKLYDRIANIQIKYISKKGAIKDRWDSKTNKGVPQAVEVTLALRAAPRKSAPEVLKKDIRYFKTCIKILVSPTPPKKEKKSVK